MPKVGNESIHDDLQVLEFDSDAVEPLTWAFKFTCCGGVEQRTGHGIANRVDKVNSDRIVVQAVLPFPSVAARCVVRGTRDVENFVPRTGRLAEIVIVGIGDNQVNGGRIIVVATGEVVVVGVQVSGHVSCSNS